MALKFKILGLFGVFLNFPAAYSLATFTLCFIAEYLYFLVFFSSRRLSLSTVQSNASLLKKGHLFFGGFPFIQLSHDRKRNMMDLSGSVVTYQDCIWRGLLGNEV